MADPTIKIRLETSAETAALKEGKKEIESVGVAARETTEDLVDMGKAGEEAADSVSRVVSRTPLDAGTPKGPITLDEVFPEFAGEKERIKRMRDEAAALQRPPDLPDASGGGTAVGAGSLGGAAGVAGIVALAVAAREVINQLADGTKRAAELAKELEGLDAAGRAAAVEAMGPLGEVIDRNSPSLIRLAEETEEVRSKFNQLKTAAGAELAPALASMQSALADIDATGLGVNVGEAIGGAILVVNDLTDAVTNMAGVIPGGTDTLVKMGVFTAQTVAPGLRMAADALGFLAEKGREFNASQANDASAKQAAELAALNEQLNKVADAYEALDAVRRANAEASAPLADQVSALLERQQAALASGNADEVVALERQISLLQEKIAAEEESAQKKEASLAATRAEIEMRTALNKAIADGNVEEQRRLEWIQQYATIYRQTSDDQLARYAANADLAKKIEGDRRKAIEEQQDAAKQAQAEYVAGLRAQYALEREQAQTRIAELRAAGATDIQIQQARMEAAERIRQIELEIAAVRGETGQIEKLQSEERKQDQAMLAQLKREEAEQAARQVASEREITAEQRGRKSAPLGRNPLGGSNVDQPVDLNAPARPRGLDDELRPRWQRPGQDPAVPQQPPTAPVPPAPTLPPPPAPGATQPGDAAPPPGTDAAKQIKDATAEAVKSLNEATKALVEGQQQISSKQVEALQELRKQSEADGEKITGAVADVGTAIAAALQAFTAELKRLESRINNQR